MTHSSLTKVQTRRSVQSMRAQLSNQQLAFAAHQMSIHARSWPGLFNARRVASYLPLNGEISPRHLEKLFHSAKIYYPRIRHFNSGLMQFYPASNIRIKNRFAIYEPKAVGEPISLKKVDVVLVPLVAFDRIGNRLGMGAGFYDRAMSFRQPQPASKRPLLLGLAHHFQEVKSLDVQEWDIPLDAILTDQELIKI